MWEETNHSHACHAEAELSRLQRDNELLRQENLALKRQAAEDRQFADARCCNMADAARDAILTMDPAGRITLYNRAAEAMFGWTVEEAIGKDLHTLIAPRQYQEAYRQGLAHFAHTGQGPAIGRTLELTALRKNGTEFPIELSLSTIRTEGQWHAIGIARDITERRQIQAALLQNEKQLQDILNSIIAGVLIIDPQTHEIVDINDSGAAMVGRSREEIIGRLCHKFVCPAERDKCPITDLGQTLDESERLLVKADGSTLPILKTVRKGTFRGRPCLIESLVPINNQKQVEDELKESLALTQATLDSTADGILVIGHDNKIKMFNARFKELTGVPDELMAQGDATLLQSAGRAHIKNHDQFQAIIAEMDERPEQERFDVVEFVNGTVLERLCRPYVIDGRVAGRVLSFHDITERFNAQKQQESLVRQVAAANEELTHFAYVVSHDLKAPLRGIRLLADWLGADYADKLGQEGAEQLALLQQRVERMHSLIDGILQYSRIGRVKGEVTTIDLNELLDDIVDTIVPPEHVEITIGKPLPTISGDRTRVSQVFQNLLSNAVKYMDKPQGQIHVACDDGPDAWTFSVTDNGPGIEPKYFERIFQIFQTLSPKDEFESTGVGLTLVKKIVEHQGGRVWVESEIGQGSRFAFTCPKQNAGDQRAARPEPTPDDRETVTSRNATCE